MLGAAAVIAHFDSSVSAAVELKRDIGTTIGNFFSYFTILSNSAAAVFLIWAGLRHLLQAGGSGRTRRPWPSGWPV